MPREKTQPTFYLRSFGPKTTEPESGQVKIEFGAEQERIDEDNDDVIGSAFDRLVKLESDMENRLKGATSCYAVALKHHDGKRRRYVPRPRTVPITPAGARPWTHRSMPHWDSRRHWIEPLTFHRPGPPDTRTTRKLYSALQAPQTLSSPRQREARRTHDHLGF